MVTRIWIGSKMVPASERLFWSKIMGVYRAYIIGADGHIELRIDLDMRDEAAARERAKQLVDGHPVELWEGATKIETLEPEEGPPSGGLP
ncbi:hypothetical protein LRP30_24825 [Bradyrhizobium sp. C-145]|uniref:hypothetical protein n=1 Tax=Bradyrhizobium sp. C-145 TaxID=574727 RepID=UPI00201B8569|nr:hypothetical protein [Bradyrhizobium sp. C-145]UQR60246.1 hypothetical protein LRP30_24825 [Bradyrhizobium sp. C-145]